MAKNVTKSQANKSANKANVETTNNEAIETVQVVSIAPAIETVQVVETAEAPKASKVEKDKLQDFKTLVKTFNLEKQENQIMQFMVYDLSRKNKVNLKTYSLDLMLRMQQDKEFKEMVLSFK